ncbi:hypothetical protein LIX60_31055 [Streptomyces sp. S07_1.15]|uniref:hypothetical protein n=1 Tax=Streptomyces sp. S07_1.15 TaxID=2873925 RepID=UPI001D14B152|nr:hypothetical protein [Streptomyces sp. S07_1.15]MCC3655822.1 hypothetical protein [Streptomyces sp. S07_1.15]
MTATPAMPKASKRRRKTRTPHVNNRPPIAVSALKPNQIDLSSGKESLVCPDCRTWCPITGMQGSNQKLVPHHTEPAGTANPRRCTPGTNRRVVIDVTVAEWRRRLTEAVPTTASRRATKVLPKPKTTRLPAVSQIKPVPLSAETVRQAFRRHQQQCRACGQAFQHRPARESGTTGRDGQPLPCHHGERLAVTFLRLLRQEPKRRAVREAFARERRRFDRRYTDPKMRVSQWAAVLSTVEAADAQRRQLPAGDSPTEGPAVPLTTLRPEPPVR